MEKFRFLININIEAILSLNIKLYIMAGKTNAESVWDTISTAFEFFMGIQNYVKGNIDAQRERDIQAAKYAHEMTMAQMQLNMNYVESAYKIALSKLTLVIDSYNSILQNSFDTFGKTVSDTAAQMAKSASQRAYDIEKNRIETLKEKRTYDITQQVLAYEKNRQIEIEGQRLSEKNFRERAAKVGLGGLDLFMTEDAIKRMEEGKKLQKEDQDAMKKALTTLFEKEAEMEEKKLEAQKKAYDMQVDFADKVYKYVLDVDQAATTMGVKLGIGSNKAFVDAFREGMVRTVRDVADLNRSEKDIEAATGQIANISGRTGMMSTADLRNLFGAGYLVTDEVAQRVAGSMNIFNRSAEKSSQQIADIYQRANKMGISGQKVTKTIADNMKLANQYNFRGGVDGMMQMAMWAEKTRFNMSELSPMINKIMDGGLEGLIKQSAQLNVLGGAAGALSDPFGMAFEAMADPLAFGKRMQAMTEGMGTWNSKTGQMDFGIEESLRLSAIAKAQGRSVESLRNEIQDRGRRDRVGKIIGNRFGEATDAVASKAYYDQASGQWKVNVMGASGQYEAKNINELSQAEADTLAPMVEPMDQMVDMVRRILSLKEQEAAEGKIETAAGGVQKQGEIREAHLEMLAKKMQHFEDNMPQYMETISLGVQQMKNAQTATLNSFSSAFEQLKKAAGVQWESLQIVDTVRETTEKLKENTDKISELWSGGTYKAIENTMPGAKSLTDKNAAQAVSRYSGYGSDMFEKNKEQIAQQKKEIEGERVNLHEGAVGRAILPVFQNIIYDIEASQAAKQNSKNLGRSQRLGYDNSGFMGPWNYNPPATPWSEYGPLPLNLTNDFQYSGGSVMILADNNAFVTHPSDVVTASRKGGAIDDVSKDRLSSSIGPENIRLNVDGNIQLSLNGSSVSLITEEMLRDKAFINEITNLIFKFKETGRLHTQSI